MTQLDGSGEATKYSAEAPPAEYDGVIYYVTGADDMFAVSVASGKILWSHRANCRKQSPTSAAAGITAVSRSVVGWFTRRC